MMFKCQILDIEVQEIGRKKTWTSEEKTGCSPKKNFSLEDINVSFVKTLK